METRVYRFQNSETKLIEQIVNADEVQINHIVLPPGEKVPEHYSNSNVYLVIVRGSMTFTLEGKREKYSQGEVVAIPYRTRMLIENRDGETLEFFVVKAPHPEKYRPS